MYSYLVFIVNDAGRAKRPMLAFAEGVAFPFVVAHAHRSLRRFVILRQSDMVQVYASHAADRVSGKPQQETKEVQP